MKILKAILQFIWEGGSYPPGGYIPPPAPKEETDESNPTCALADNLLDCKHNEGRTGSTASSDRSAQTAQGGQS